MELSPKKLHPPPTFVKIFSPYRWMNVEQICSDMQKLVSSVIEKHIKGYSLDISIFDMVILTVRNTDKLCIHIFQLSFNLNQTLFSSNSAEISQSRKFYCFSTYFNAELTKSDNALCWAFFQRHLTLCACSLNAQSVACNVVTWMLHYGERHL